MDAKIFATIAITGFSVAFFHAAIPTHWLPFVLTARVQKWSWSKTLLITTLAGGGHVLFTAALGFLVAWCGIKLSDKIGGWFPWIAGGALIAFGLYYVIQQIRGKGHGHSHLFAGHAHEHHEVDHGPRGGFLLNLGHGFVEITVFEIDVLPHFRLFFYDKEKRARSVPTQATVKLETVRSDSVRQTFAFRTAGEYLESTSDIPEPHEFKVILQLSHGHHSHNHEVQFEEHDHGHAHHADDRCDHENEVVQPPPRKSDWAAILSLLALLTFSPCEGFLPVYVSGVRYGWTGFFLLTLILSVATIAGMLVFTGLALAGMETLRLHFIEKYERGIFGGLLCLLGLVIIFEH
jgi:ABC-type nickel/cobalt efflux system permease component RcnA